MATCILQNTESKGAHKFKFCLKDIVSGIFQNYGLIELLDVKHFKGMAKSKLKGHRCVNIFIDPIMTHELTFGICDKKLEKEWYLGLTLRYNLSGVGVRERDTYKKFVGD